MRLPEGGSSSARDTGLWLAHGLEVLLGLVGGSIGVGFLFVQQTFAVGPDALGAYLATAMIGRLIMSFISGSLAARIGLRALLVGGAGLVTAGLVGQALAPSWTVLVAASFLIGLGDAATLNAVSTHVARRHNARRMNWLFAAFGVGLALGPLYIQAVVQAAGDSIDPWRNAYFLLAASFLLIAVLLWFTTQHWDRLPTLAGQTQAPIVAAAPQHTMLIPLLIISMIGFFIYGGLEITAGNYLPLLFSARGVNVTLYATWISLMWATYTAGRILLGSFVEQLGRTRIVRLMIVTMAAGIAMVWRLPGDEASLIGMAILGLGMSIYGPTVLADIPMRLGVHHTANAVGFLLGMASLGGAIIPSLVGQLANRDIQVIGPILFILAVILFVIHEITSRTRHSPEQ